MRVAAILLLLTATTQAQWQLQQSHTTAGLRGIHALSSEIAWASGTNGTILHTTDGGTTWLHCTTPPDADKLDFRGIQGFDAQTAIVMSSGKGDLSRLYKTTDACKSWKLIITNPDPDGFWDAIGFDTSTGRANPSWNLHGVLVGDPVHGEFVIFTSWNSGDTWLPWVSSKRLLPAKARPGESLFAASNSTLVVPGNNGQFAFVTGGSGGARLIFEQHHDPCDCNPWENFSDIRLPIPSSESAGAFALARRSDKEYTSIADFMVVGGDYKKPDAPGTSAFEPYSAPPWLYSLAESLHPPPHPTATAAP
jgi:photosystem II stability/assembly factor-like uncharacterized protein